MFKNMFYFYSLLHLSLCVNQSLLLAWYQLSHPNVQWQGFYSKGGLHNVVFMVRGTLVATCVSTVCLHCVETPLLSLPLSSLSRSLPLVMVPPPFSFFFSMNARNIPENYFRPNFVLVILQTPPFEGTSFHWGSIWARCRRVLGRPCVVDCTK